MKTDPAEMESPFWRSPITAANLGSQLRLTDAVWDSDGETLVWREERSDRGVLVCRNPDHEAARDLTGEVQVRAQVGYGGGDFTVSRGSVFFISEGRILRQALTAAEAEPITAKGGEATSPAVSPDGRHLLYVHSDGEVDRLLMTAAEGRGSPVPLAEGNDFYMQPCWHPNSRHLAFVAWNHPHMPWDASTLYLARLSSKGPHRLRELEIVDGGDCAVFQPAFSPDGRHLSYLSDREGWMQVHLRDLESGTTRRVVEEEADFGLPAWIHGLRTQAWDPEGRLLYLLKSRQGLTTLVRLHIESGRMEEMGGDLGRFTSYFQISSAPGSGRLAVIASAFDSPSRVIAAQPGGSVTVLQSSGSSRELASYCSPPRPVSWPVREENGPERCFGLYYPPCNPDYRVSVPPAAVIKIHGGPTSHYSADYHGDTQFFTSRGFAILELNYRGSSGHGRAYMESLRGQWGVLDVEDTRAAAEFLVSEGLADPAGLVLMGGSAGGFTLLLSLISHPGRFRAAVCKFGVSNLFTLADDTHKFERHYLDSLVGTLPRDEPRFRQRSPVFSADRIQDPVAIFQGEKDRVVPRSQSDEIAASLSRRGVPHLYQVYPGEGHGWRKSETIQDYYTRVEAFLALHLPGTGQE